MFGKKFQIKIKGLDPFRRHPQTALTGEVFFVGALDGFAVVQKHYAGTMSVNSRVGICQSKTQNRIFPPIPFPGQKRDHTGSTRPGGTKTIFAAQAPLTIQPGFCPVMSYPDAPAVGSFKGQTFAQIFGIKDYRTHFIDLGLIFF